MSLNLANVVCHTTQGLLTCHKILWHEADGFTSPPKEGMLRIFIVLKNPSLPARFEPTNPLGPMASTLIIIPLRTLLQLLKISFNNLLTHHASGYNSKVQESKLQQLITQAFSFSYLLCSQSYEELHFPHSNSSLLEQKKFTNTKAKHSNQFWASWIQSTRSKVVKILLSILSSVKTLHVHWKLTWTAMHCCVFLLKVIVMLLNPANSPTNEMKSMETHYLCSRHFILEQSFI
jgi:hypothetical protein